LLCAILQQNQGTKRQKSAGERAESGSNSRETKGSGATLPSGGDPAAENPSEVARGGRSRRRAGSDSMPDRRRADGGGPRAAGLGGEGGAPNSGGCGRAAHQCELLVAGWPQLAPPRKTRRIE
jgi:hypothetical protein